MNIFDIKNTELIITKEEYSDYKECLRLNHIYHLPRKTTSL